jgi:regulator of nucleoside diphosphate kinase
MRAPFIFLYPDITRRDAENLIRWLRDDEVRRYLSDAQNVSSSLEQLLSRVDLPVLTHLFSAGGRFYMVSDRHERPVGFVRLVLSPNDTEIVLVIGERMSWGTGFGTAALKEALRIAFFEFRSNQVVANIHRDNHRSLRTFKSAGFTKVHEGASMLRFTLTMRDYISQVQRRAAMKSKIHITQIDKERLLKLLQEVSETESATPDAVRALLDEVDRATVIDANEIPADVITMNSRALLTLNGAELEASLVYPDEADWQHKRVSVLSPIGTAILGYTEGETVRWEIPSGMADIHIKKVLFQPEAAKDFSL